MNEQHNQPVFHDLDSLLSFIISTIEYNYHFFQHWAKKVSRKALRDALLEFAEEELQHKETILSLRDNHEFQDIPPKVPDLKLSDYFVEVEPSEDMSYQEALQIAMKRESAAIDTFRYLASISTSPRARSILETLAIETARHKHDFEKQYLDKFMSEN